MKYNVYQMKNCCKVESRARLLPFGAESFVFQFSIQKCKD